MGVTNPLLALPCAPLMNLTLPAVRKQTFSRTPKNTHTHEVSQEKRDAELLGSQAQFFTSANTDSDGRRSLEEAVGHWMTHDE
jgi:hypothetical protein